MRTNTARAAALPAVLTAAAILVPSPAAAHAVELPAGRPHEQISAQTGILRLLPPLNRGTVAALPEDRDPEA